MFTSPLGKQYSGSCLHKHFWNPQSPALFAFFDYQTIFPVTSANLIKVKRSGKNCSAQRDIFECTEREKLSDHGAQDNHLSLEEYTSTVTSYTAYNSVRARLEWELEFRELLGKALMYREFTLTKGFWGEILWTESFFFSPKSWFK